MFIREWILQAYRGKHARRILATLSARFCAAAARLGVRHVPNMFCEQHGSLSGAHYRAFAEVVEVITLDFIGKGTTMARVISATVTWYWASRATSFTQDDLVSLREKCVELCAAWRLLDVPAWRATLRAVKEKRFPKNCVLKTHKFHRALDHSTYYVEEYGPMEHITTEVSEGLHKPLKAYFRV